MDASRTGRRPMVNRLAGPLRRLRVPRCTQKRQPAPYSAAAIIVIATMAMVGYAGLNRPTSAPHIVKGDGEGYYAYLTAYVVERDPSFRSLVDHRFAAADLRQLSGLSYQPRTGRYLDKFSPGEALLTLPFFTAGHVVARLGGERADGYSRSEELFSGLAAIAWSLIGLAALRRVLLRRFSDAVTAATLVCVSLGTSLLHYMAFDSSYSHAFSFAAICLTLLGVVRWMEHPDSWRRAVHGGLSIGLVICIRPANIATLVPLLTFGMVSRPTLRARALLFARNWQRILLGAAAAAPLILGNLLAWRYAAGRLVFFSYRQDEHFAFLHPQWQVLYSFKPHGLLPYAPVLALATIGILSLHRRAPEWFWPVILALSLETFLLASWSAWPLGDAFGQRGYVDVDGIFALPLAALLTAAWPTRWRWAVGALAGMATLTTMLGTAAYWQHRLPHDGATPNAYLAAITGHDSNNHPARPHPSTGRTGG